MNHHHRRGEDTNPRLDPALPPQMPPTPFPTGLSTHPPEDHRDHYRDDGRDAGRAGDRGWPMDGLFDDPSTARLFDDPAVARLFDPHAVDRPPARTPQAAVREVEQIRPDHLRRRAVSRLRLVGDRHARHHTDLHATATPPGPHAIVFFYRDPTPDQPDQPDQPHQPRADELRVATRMFLDGEDVTDLPTVLHTLYQRARDYHTAGAVDPRRHLSTHAEPMSEASTYLGIGTSSLQPARPERRTEGDWRGLARLVDGTRLTLRVPRPGELMDVESTHTLDVAGAALALNPPYTWRWARPDLYRPGSDLDRARAALDQLHDFLALADIQGWPWRHR